jgi:hypothetical protein
MLEDFDKRKRHADVRFRQALRLGNPFGDILV